MLVSNTWFKLESCFVNSAVQNSKILVSVFVKALG